LPPASPTPRASPAWTPSSASGRRPAASSFYLTRLPRRLLVIRNPAAGRGRAVREWDAVTRRLRAANVSFQETTTGAPLEAIAIARREAPRFDGIVAAGGDGTVHEVANGLLESRSGAALGVIPLGSGDDFHKLLGEGDPVARLAGHATRQMDAGCIDAERGRRYFVNGMDIGFGAHAARNLRRVPAALTGFAAYLGALALTLLRYPQLALRLQLDDGPMLPVKTAMTAAMNGTTFGGSFQVCPAANPADGLLDTLVVDAIGRAAILALVPRILRGSHAGHPRLRMAQVRRIAIESEAPLLVEADGEIAFEDARQLRVQVLPGALRVFG
jgi:diacylglycerol kinase (ATP)